MKKRMLSLLCLAVLLAGCLAGCNQKQDETVIPYQPSDSIYGVTEVKYVSPLSSVAYPNDQSYERDQFSVEVGETTFSATFAGKTETVILPTYVILPVTTAFCSTDFENGSGTQVFINVYMQDIDGTILPLGPDVTKYGSLEAYAVYDQEGEDTGYIIYTLDNEMWVGRFGDKDGTMSTPDDYIVKTDIKDLSENKNI